MRKFVKLSELAAGESVTIRFLEPSKPMEYEDTANLAAVDPMGLYPKDEHRCPLCEAGVPLVGVKQES